MKIKTPVKYFAAILTPDPEGLPKVLKKLEKEFGKVDYAGSWVDFNFTRFYECEMGPDLKRCLISFTGVKPSQDLPKGKIKAQKVEDHFRNKKGDRVYNIDIGYLDYCKVVLASGKFGGHKIAITKDCFADMILDYQKGKFRPFEWCFPDFAGGFYDRDLLKIRELYKKENDD